MTDQPAAPDVGSTDLRQRFATLLLAHPESSLVAAMLQGYELGKQEERAHIATWLHQRADSKEPVYLREAKALWEAAEMVASSMDHEKGG